MTSFPYKLHQLLTDVEESEEFSSIISWLPTGNGFRLHNPVLFEQLILPKYFPRQKKLKSFKRQVQYYCFENLGNGSYIHQHFIRGHKSRCGKMMHKLPMKQHQQQKNKDNQRPTSSQSPSTADSNFVDGGMINASSLHHHGMAALRAMNLVPLLPQVTPPSSVNGLIHHNSSASSGSCAFPSLPETIPPRPPISITNKVRRVSLPNLHHSTSSSLPTTLTDSLSSSSSHHHHQLALLGAGSGHHHYPYPSGGSVTQMLQQSRNMASQYWSQLRTNDDIQNQVWKNNTDVGAQPPPTGVAATGVATATASAPATTEEEAIALLLQQKQQKQEQEQRNQQLYSSGRLHSLLSAIEAKRDANITPTEEEV